MHVCLVSQTLYLKSEGKIGPVGKADFDWSGQEVGVVNYNGCG